MAAPGNLELGVFSPWPLWPEHGVTLMLCQSWGGDSDPLSLYLIFNVPKSASLPVAPSGFCRALWQELLFLS